MKRAPKTLVLGGLAAVALLACLWGFASGSRPEPPLRTEPFAAPPPPSTAVADPATSPTPGERAVLDVVEERFEVLVDTDADRPIADARVLLAASDEVRDGRTDRNGLVSFAAEASPANVLVVPGDRPPVLRAVTAMRGRETIVLAAGELVAGRVTVIDRPLPAPVQLELCVGGLVSPLPEPLPAWLAREQIDLRRLTTRTDASGVFTFAGLAPMASGTLGLPFAEPYWLRPQETSLPVVSERQARLARPTTGVTLSLTQLPTVRGRIVWDDGRVAAGAVLNARVDFAGGGHSPTTGASVDRNGRFAVGFASSRAAEHEAWLDPKNHAAIARLTVQWGHADARKREHRQWLAGELGPDPDVGDLVLEPAPALHVLVRNTDGLPIAGARFDARMPALTAADGRGIVLATDTAQRTFGIGAPGCLVESYTAEGGTGSEADPLLFTLRRGNRLIVRVRAGEFAVADLRVELYAATPPFTAQKNGWYPTPIHVAAGSTKWVQAGAHVDRSGEALFEPDDAGLVTFASLLPDLPIRLRVLDRIDGVVAERSLRSPGRKETVEVVLETQAHAATIEAQVTLEGAPLADATVEPGGRTGADGRVTLRLLASTTPITVKIDHPAAVRLTTEIVPQPGTQRPHFALARGYDLEVRVVDAAGAAVEATIVAPTADRSNLGPGHVRFRRLPAKDVTLRATVEDRTLERTVDPATVPVLMIRTSAR